MKLSHFLFLCFLFLIAVTWFPKTTFWKKAKLTANLSSTIIKSESKVIRVEDGTNVGGFGSAVLEFMNEHHYKAEIKMRGIPDRWVEHGTLKELHRECGYDAQAIAEAVREMMKDKVSVSQLAG